MPINYTFLNDSILIQLTKEEYQAIVKKYIEEHKDEFELFKKGRGYAAI